MSSIFTRIIDGEIPCHKIAENEHCFAFLDIHPLSKGHTLVVPKQEVDYLFDLEDDLLAELILFAKPIAHAIQAVIPCTRIGMTVIGLEVPHAHIHLIPIEGIADMDFGKPKLELSQAELGEIATMIREQLG